MARNGSGVMNPVTNSWNPQVNGVLATGPDFNSLYLDLITALTQSLSSDGQTPLTGNLQMGGNKLTGLGAGTGTGQSLRWEQLFDQGLETDIASAATTDIGTQNTNFLRITGTTGITSFGTTYRGPRFLRFAGALTLTNSATLVLPGAANITTAAGDTAIAYPIGNPATGWIVAAYRVAANSLTPPISKIFPITASVATNILTATLNPCSMDFRSATIGSGATNLRNVSAAITVAVPATATLGTTSGVLARLVLVAIDNAGSVELAIINVPSTTTLDETALISTTAITVAANSQNVFYSTTARSNVPYRIVGYIETTQATAGQWATAPSKIQGAGGEAVTYLGVPLPTLPAVVGSFANLRASATGLSALVTVTADELMVETTTNLYSTLRAISVTPSLAVSGVNGLDTGTSAISTWYAIWIISNGTTTAGLLSLSATAPTMPAGYTYKARVGWVRSDATANKYPLSFTQAGRNVQYKVAAGSNVTGVPVLASGAAGSTTIPTYISTNVSSAVPTTAARIRGNLSCPASNQAIVAPNSAYGSYTSTANPPTLSLGTGAGAYMIAPFDIALETAAISWAASAGGLLTCNGWEDNL